MMLLAAVLTLLVGLLLWWQAGRRQASAGLPIAHILTQDTERGEPPSAAMTSHRLRLTGRPDYLLRRHGVVIPVEVKPRRLAQAPYAGDLLQLAAYCLLLEETTGQAPPYGILRYAHRSWQLPYGDDARAGVLAALADIAHDRAAAEVPRSHEQPARCAACGLRHDCDQRLA
jgi:CRISPR-associated exonuclease Cas4